MPPRNPVVFVGTAQDALVLQGMAESRLLHYADFLFEPESGEELRATWDLPAIMEDKRGAVSWVYDYTDPKTGRDVLKLKWEMSQEDKNYFFNPLTLYDEQNERGDMESAEDRTGDW